MYTLLMKAPTLCGAITAADFEFVLGQSNDRAPGPDGLPFEILWHAPDSMEETIRACINSNTDWGGVPSSILDGRADLLPSQKRRCS